MMPNDSRYIITCGRTGRSRGERLWRYVAVHIIQMFVLMYLFILQQAVEYFERVNEMLPSQDGRAVYW